MDSRADILIYGMGEKAVLEIAEALDSGIEASDISWIRGTSVKAKAAERGGSLFIEDDDVVLPAYESLLPESYSETSGDAEASCAAEAAKAAYCRSFALQYRSNDSVTGKRILEEYPDGTYVVQNPPQPPLEGMDLDDLYDLPYMRECHPIYDEEGGRDARSEAEARNRSYAKQSS